MLVTSSGCVFPRRISRGKPVLADPAEEACAIKHGRISDMVVDDEGNIYTTGNVTADNSDGYRPEHSF